LIWLPDERFLQDSSLVFAFGAARSGKTTIARLAASFEGVNHVDEYWPLLAISIAANNDEISKETFSSISKCMISELQNDSALLRFANFRPKDASSIFKYKSKLEIFQRLVKLKSRDDSAKYIKDNNYILWMTCTDLNICESHFRNTFKISPMILILRHPAEVASEIVKKKWFSDQTLLKPLFNTPSVKHYSSRLKSDLFLPWWLPRSEYEFWIDSNEFTRGLVYWKVMHNDHLIDTGRTSKYSATITWNALVQSPELILPKLETILQKKSTNKTDKIIKSIRHYNFKKFTVPSSSEATMHELQPLISKFDLVTS
jgi:hypothetical protein